MKKNCLIVDDSSTIRKILQHMFAEFGFNCAEAENGQAAYDYCAQKTPDVIMLDWNMPVMSGIDFMNKVTAMRGHPPCPVIFCTTESDMSFITRALDAGAADYIMKPFEKDVLRGKLEGLGLLAAENSPA